MVMKDRFDLEQTFTVLERLRPQLENILELNDGRTN